MLCKRITSGYNRFYRVHAVYVIWILQMDEKILISTGCAQSISSFSEDDRLLFLTVIVIFLV